ncbi:Branched-chain amino acid transport [[Clostridium] ultunense Esp]|nr:Branched-chain amino acid transport [[Clostridium] ultunense Esp]
MMSLRDLILMVLGMALVTYLPRLLPFLFLQRLFIPPRLRRFFSFIPYAMLGALIVPGVFTSTGDLSSAIVGFLVAVLLVWLKLHVVFVITGAIFAVYLFQLFF